MLKIYSIEIGTIEINNCEYTVELLINDVNEYFNIDFDANIIFKKDLAKKIKNEINNFIIKESFKFQERKDMLEALREVEKEIKDI